MPIYRGSSDASISSTDRFDVIVANLPYIGRQEYEGLPREIREYEPPESLLGGERGTELIEALLLQVPPLLRRPGLFIAEHAWNQGARLREAARSAFPDGRIETVRDLAGLDRALLIQAD
jgi:release factor glutamine methyltransferase